MDLASVPETIRTIIDQAGGLGLRGAFAYIGAQDFRYRCARPDGEYRSAYRSRLTSEGGPPRVEFDVGLQARVNGKLGREGVLPETPMGEPIALYASPVVARAVISRQRIAASRQISA